MELVSCALQHYEKSGEFFFIYVNCLSLFLYKGFSYKGPERQLKTTQQRFRSAQITFHVPLFYLVYNNLNSYVLKIGLTIQGSCQNDWHIEEVDVES